MIRQQKMSKSINCGPRIISDHDGRREGNDWLTVPHHFVLGKWIYLAVLNAGVARVQRRLLIGHSAIPCDRTPSTTTPHNFVLRLRTHALVLPPFSMHGTLEWNWTTFQVGAVRRCIVCNFDALASSSPTFQRKRLNEQFMERLWDCR